MTRIPRQIRRRLPSEGGAGSVSVEIGLLSTTVAAGTLAAIAGFGHLATDLFTDGCRAVEQAANQVNEATSHCPPDAEVTLPAP